MTSKSWRYAAFTDKVWSPEEGKLWIVVDYKDRPLRDSDNRLAVFEKLVDAVKFGNLAVGYTAQVRLLDPQVEAQSDV